MTLDDLERHNSPYFAFFADFHFFADQIMYVAVVEESLLQSLFV